MRSQKLKMVDTLMLQRFSAVADGMHVEVVVSKEKPEPLISDARTSSCRRIRPNLTVNPTAFALSVSASSFPTRWDFL